MISNKTRPCHRHHNANNNATRPLRPKTKPTKVLSPSPNEVSKNHAVRGDLITIHPVKRAEIKAATPARDPTQKCYLQSTVQMVTTHYHKRKWGLMTVVNLPGVI